MLNALLAPFSYERAKRHVQSTLDAYFETVTETSLQAQLRSGLLSNHIHDGLVAELLQASHRQGRLWELFADRARNYHIDSDNNVQVQPATTEVTDKAIWVEPFFGAFIHLRQGDDYQAHGDCIVTKMLWQSFVYNAEYPYKSTNLREEGHGLYLEEWIQAIALLATDAANNASRTRASLTLYQPSHIASTRRNAHWRRFASFAVSKVNDNGSAPAATPTTAQAKKKGLWQPPSILEEVARVAATQLPLSELHVVPPLDKIMARVHKLVPEAGLRPQCPVESLYIPYVEMVALVAAILQTRDLEDESGSITLQLSDKHRDIADRCYRLALAEAVLGAGGIDGVHAEISFAKYVAFAEKFASFDLKLTGLWRALFYGPNEDREHACTKGKGLANDVLHALDFLSPVASNGSSRQKRQQATLAYRKDKPFVEDDSDAVLHALSQTSGPKILLVRGAILGAQCEDESQPQAAKNTPAVIAVITSSPISRCYKGGRIDDFLAGNEHFLLQLAPQARALAPIRKDALLADLTTAQNFGEVTFGNEGNPGDSNLMFNFIDGHVKMSYFPLEGGYREVPVGANQAAAPRTDFNVAWETIVKLERVDVYSLPDGVDENLVVERPPFDQDTDPDADAD